jgi:hypothetical protein
MYNIFTLLGFFNKLRKFSKFSVKILTKLPKLAGILCPWYLEEGGGISNSPSLIIKINKLYIILYILITYSFF